MRRSKIQVLVIVASIVALSAPAEARPRLFRVIGALATAPIAIIAGAAHARARHYRSREAYVPRQKLASAQIENHTPAGWVGPVFWPDASGDLLDYMFGLPGGAGRFWSYGYDDVLAAMFGSSKLPYERQRRNRGTRVAETASDFQSLDQSWRGLCGQPPGRVDELLERLRVRLASTPHQSTALDGLKEALIQANARIVAACPDKLALEPTERIDLMVSRLTAIRMAASTVLPPLRAIYASLDERQKALFNAEDFEQPQTVNAPIRASSSPCAEKSEEWPTAAITRRLRLQGEQLAALEKLRLTSASFEGFVATTCNVNAAKNPIDRLEAARKRVNVIRYAVVHIRPALNEFYASLDAGQRARFGSLNR
jgi:hypothetical protein